MGLQGHLRQSAAWPLIVLAGLATGPAYGADQNGSDTPVTARGDSSSLTLDAVTVTGNDKTTQGYQPLATSTATRSETPLLDIPQAVNIVSDQVIEDQHATSLDEALANVSGIAQSNSLGGTQDAVIRRGFGDNRDGSILINGMKVSLPRAFNATTERVEVLKGPASTLYGILDPGGLINVVTKPPEDRFSGSVYGSLSSFGGGNTGFDLTGPLSDSGFSYRIIGDYRHLDYWRNFGAYKNTMIAPSVAWKNEKTSVVLSYFHEEYSVPFDRGTIFDTTTGKAVNVNRRTRFDEGYNISKGTSDMVQLTMDHRLSQDWKLGFDYSYSRNEYSDNQARVTGYDSSTGDVTRRADATQYSTIYNHAIRSDLTGNVELGGFKHELLFGSSYDYSDTLRTDMIRCKASVNFNVYSPTYGELPACTTVSASDSDQAEKLSTVSFYAQDNWHINDQWIIVGGLRYQYYDLMAGKGRPFVANTDSYGDAIVPNGGIVYKLTPELSFYANAAQTFRPQSSIASYYGSLPPEKGTSYEIGAKVDLFGRLTGNLALYTSEKENVAYSEDVGGTTVVKTAGLVRARGLEVDIAGSLTDHIDLIASYGYTDAKVLKDPQYAGLRPVNVPEHTGSLYLTYDFHSVTGDGDSFKVGAGMRAVGERAGISSNGYFLPGYAVFDAFAAYTFNFKQPLTVRLNLKNLLDTTYYTSSIGTTAYGNQIGEPFNATLTAEVRF